MLMYDKISFRCHLRKQTIYNLKLPVCHSCNTAVMGNDNESFPHLFPYILKQFHDFAAAFAVQISRRLISKNYIRLCNQSAGDGYTLLLAAG